jgi:hypothetical protein
MAEIIGLWIMYGKPREPKAFFEFGERVLVKKHLQFLIKKCMIRQKGEKYFLV